MRSKSFILVAGLLATLTALLGGMWFYDKSQKDQIAKGIKVAGVDVGGLSASQARTKLSNDLLGRLNQPVVVMHNGRRFELTPARANVAVNLGAVVDQALARSRKDSIFGRTFRNITEGAINADITPEIHYSQAAVNALVKRVSKTINRPAQNAAVTFSGASLGQQPGHTGQTVRARALTQQVQQALSNPGSPHTVAVAVRKIRPTVTKRQLVGKYRTVITIDRGNFKLHLWKNLKPDKTYDIAVGRQGLETPTGVYTVGDKQIDPAWHVPNSAWAGSLAGQTIPPGPQDPLKARWIGISGGAGIHGIDPSEYGSIGTAGSHGCVRMRIPDVIDLYDRTPYGSTIYVQ